MAVDNLAPEAFLTGKVGHVWLPMVTRANKYGVKISVFLFFSTLLKELENRTKYEKEQKQREVRGSKDVKKRIFQKVFEVNLRDFISAS